jgi:formiminotetrahydrofolate cyclodeaminase
MPSLPALISLPTDDLLERFGDDRPTPGSGCAAALMGLLSASLLCAVSRLTIAKASEPDRQSEASLVLQAIETRIAPNLRRIFQTDADIFENVIALRMRRDAATDPAEKSQLARKANAALQPATDILFEISDLCFDLMANGLGLYRRGYQGAKGDTGAALSAAVAAITSAMFVVSLNAKTSKAAWARQAMQKVEEVQDRLRRSQREVFTLITQSREEALESIQLGFEGFAGPRQAD